MTDETILTNAILVLPDATLHGTLVVQDGRISDVQPGRSGALPAHDLDGDYLIAGIVDTHTDNLERQVQPRSLARWPSRSAMVAHDAQCAAAGVTTVFDALCLGDLGFDKERMRTFREGVVDLDALNDAGLLKSEHFLHLRCEVPALDMLALFDTVADHVLVRIVSLMDHSPGVGQYADSYSTARCAAAAGWTTPISSSASANCRHSANGCAFPTAALCSSVSPAATSPSRATTTGPSRRSRRTPPTESA